MVEATNPEPAPRSITDAPAGRSAHSRSRSTWSTSSSAKRNAWRIGNRRAAAATASSRFGDGSVFTLLRSPPGRYPQARWASSARGLDTTWASDEGVERRNRALDYHVGQVGSREIPGQQLLDGRPSHERHQTVKAFDAREAVERVAGPAALDERFLRARLESSVQDAEGERGLAADV